MGMEDSGTAKSGTSWASSGVLLALFVGAVVLALGACLGDRDPAVTEPPGAVVIQEAVTEVPAADSTPTTPSTPTMTAEPAEGPSGTPAVTTTPRVTPTPMPRPTTGVISTDEDGLILSMAEFQSFEKGVLALKRGDEVLTIQYDEADNPVSVQATWQHSPDSAYLIHPEQLPPGSFVKLYSHFVDGAEVFSVALLTSTALPTAVATNPILKDLILPLPWASDGLTEES